MAVALQCVTLSSPQRRKLEGIPLFQQVGRWGDVVFLLHIALTEMLVVG